MSYNINVRIKITYMRKYLIIFSGFVAVICLSAWSFSNRKADISQYLNVFSSEKTESANSGWVYWFVRESQTEKINLKMTYVDKQTELHPPHTHPEKEIYYIIEGQAEVFINGKTKVIGPNSSLFCPPGTLHGIRRADDKPLKYLVIKDNKGKSVVDKEPLPEYTIDDCITVFDSQKVDKTKTGYFFWFAPKATTRGLNLKMTYVDELTGTHEPHQHAGEEILYLLEGTAEAHINGEIKVIEPNTSIYYPEHSLHCIKRANDKPIKYLVINH